MDAIALIRWLLALVLLAGCASHAAAVQNDTASAEAAPKSRIVTLVPSFAEDLVAIGAGDRIVAVSSFTDAPQLAKLPRVADFTSVDSEKIVALHPDLVAAIPAQRRLVQPLIRAGLDVVVVPDDSFDEIFTTLQTFGELTGREAAAAATVARLRRETAALHARTQAFVRHPSVFVVLGVAPIWTAGAGSYIATLIRLAGGTNAAADLPAAYAEYSDEALLRAQPDAIVADPAVHLDTVLNREPWRSLRAVQHHRVYFVDPDLILRPGPNYNAGLRWLVERLTPLAERH